MKEKVCILAEHILGRKISGADFISRSFNDNIEWQLSTKLFQKPAKQFSVIPSIDLFTSHLKKQLERYVSWYHDPCCYAVDAFNLSVYVFMYI